jgi:hypothetical protein
MLVKRKGDVMKVREMLQDFLEQVAPDRIIERGEDLYLEGAVKDVKISSETVTAKVYGGSLYNVKAVYKKGHFNFSCTCPYEDFCKHSVALALWVIRNDIDIAPQDAGDTNKSSGLNISTLIEKASPAQKDQFLSKALNEFPLLLSRFEAMVKGIGNIGGDIDIDRLAIEIKTELERFDLTDYERFYDSEPDRHGYREEWKVLQDGAEDEFNELFDQFGDHVLELLEAHNVIGSFKYLVALYEAILISDLGSIDDPANIYDGYGLDNLAETKMDLTLDKFAAGMQKLTLDENIYFQLIDIYFKQAAKSHNGQKYLISDFKDIFHLCIQSKNIALHLAQILEKTSVFGENDYCELLLAAYKQTGNTDKWLKLAERNYKTHPDVAEKYLNYFTDQKERLTQLGREIAFQFNNKFIPFFYKNLTKNADPELYQRILCAHARDSKSVEVYKELKKEYGETIAWEFIKSVEKNWSADHFLVQLLEEEKAYEYLLTLAKAKSHPTPALLYLKPIIHVYPDQVFEIISSRTNPFLEKNLGREYYRQAAEWLKLLQKVSDKSTKERAQKFVKSLMEKYNNRSALKDELRKAGLI